MYKGAWSIYLYICTFIYYTEFQIENIMFIPLLSVEDTWLIVL